MLLSTGSTPVLKVSELAQAGGRHHDSQQQVLCDSRCKRYQMRHAAVLGVAQTCGATALPAIGLLHCPQGCCQRYKLPQLMIDHQRDCCIHIQPSMTAAKLFLSSVQHTGAPHGHQMACAGLKSRTGHPDESVPSLCDVCNARIVCRHTGGIVLRLRQEEQARASTCREGCPAERALWLGALQLRHAVQAAIVSCTAANVCSQLFSRLLALSDTLPRFKAVAGC